MGVVGQRLESAAGCLLHRWVPPAPWGAVGTQPKVLSAAAGAPRTRRDRRPGHRPQRQQTPEPTENGLFRFESVDVVVGAGVRGVSRLSQIQEQPEHLTDLAEENWPYDSSVIRQPRDGDRPHMLTLRR